MHADVHHLPHPSKEHATCAWCAEQFRSIIELIDHVDAAHLPTEAADLAA